MWSQKNVEEKIDLHNGHTSYYRNTENRKTNSVGFLIHEKKTNMEYGNELHRFARLNRYQAAIRGKLSKFMYQWTTLIKKLRIFYEEVNSVNRKGKCYIKLIVRKWNVKIWRTHPLPRQVSSRYGMRNDKGKGWLSLQHVIRCTSLIQL